MMFDYILFDVETVPTNDGDFIRKMQDDPVTFKPTPRMPKAQKDFWAKLTDEEKLDFHLQKTALTSYATPVVVVSIGFSMSAPGLETQIFQLGDYENKDPERAMTQFMRDLANYWAGHTHDRTVWAGHNIRRFDVPLLLFKWAKHQQIPPAEFPVPRGWRIYGKTWDSCEDAFMVGEKYASLLDVCDAYGVTMPKQELPEKDHPFDIYGITKWHRAGQYNRIVEHCYADVAAVLDIMKLATFNFNLM